MTDALSIIIPALNAEALIVRTVSAICPGCEIPDLEIIVADGGSTDRTAAAAAGAGARVIVVPRGRGSQIAAGIAAAAHPWLLILHADTRPGPGWRDAVAAHTRTPGVAGYFRFALESRDPRARRLERIVAWRCRVLGLPYGDQGLLIHRDLLRAVGGMKPLPLMEDVDLIRRLGRRRLRRLPADAVTSAARWERDGYIRRSARNLLCLLMWFAGVPPRVIARLYA
jgi:rSAM/selenodomain-associated transferase 2